MFMNPSFAVDASLFALSKVLDSLFEGTHRDFGGSLDDGTPLWVINYFAVIGIREEIVNGFVVDLYVGE